MKGQASFEFLIVLLIFFSIFSLWLTATSEAQKKMSHAVALMDAKMIADRLASSINRVYVMGNGNEETLSFYMPEDANITIEKNRIYVSLNNKTYVRHIHNAERTHLNLKKTDKIVVKNIEGRVILFPST